MTIAVDRAFLEEHATMVADGIEERVFYMDVEGARCFALLTRPGEPADLGFVICHSYGLELLILRRAERAVARALAGLGHPVLAFHRRGYGDSTGSLSEATLSWHREDVRAAAARLSEETGTRRLGLIGARFGGLIAAVVAAEGGVDRLLLMNPTLVGRTYFHRTIKEMHMVHVTTNQGGPRRSMEDILESMRREGMVDVLGHPIYRHLYDSLADVGLVERLGSFGGDVLIFDVSKASEPSPELEAVREAISRAGGRCRIEIVREPPGARFGGAAFVAVDDPTVRVDVQQPIGEEMARRAAEWMSG